MDYPKASRNTDPWTSHAAEAEMTASGKRKKQADMCLQYVIDNPGRTYRELAQISGVDDRNVFSRRLNDLRTKGKVVSEEPRKCAVSGRSMQVWYATPVQERLF